MGYVERAKARAEYRKLKNYEKLYGKNGCPTNRERKSQEYDIKVSREKLIVDGVIIPIDDIISIHLENSLNVPGYEDHWLVVITYKAIVGYALFTGTPKFGHKYKNLHFESLPGEDQTAAKKDAERCYLKMIKDLI